METYGTLYLPKLNTNQIINIENITPKEAIDFIKAYYSSMCSAMKYTWCMANEYVDLMTFHSDRIDFDSIPCNTLQSTVLKMIYEWTNVMFEGKKMKRPLYVSPNGIGLGNVIVGNGTIINNYVNENDDQLFKRVNDRIDNHQYHDMI